MANRRLGADDSAALSEFGKQTAKIRIETTSE
jgi:hypothetical protein